jgi:hypothetical protein
VRPSAEAWLMLLAAALYLVDSFWLLASNEAVLFRGGRGRWQAGFGAMRWRLIGREPYLPNPFMPHRPQLLLAWHMESAEPRGHGAPPLHLPAELARFAPFACGAGVLLFGLLPIVLFARLGTGFTLAVVALLYTVNIAALLQLWWLRGPLKLTKPQAAQLVFECLVCPPFSVNLVRRLCARLRHDEDFVAAAARVLKPEDLVTAHTQCLLRLDEQIECEPEASTRLTLLQAARSRFVARPPNPQA